MAGYLDGSCAASYLESSRTTYKNVFLAILSYVFHHVELADLLTLIRVERAFPLSQASSVPHLLSAFLVFKIWVVLLFASSELLHVIVPVTDNTLAVGPYLV